MTVTGVSLAEIPSWVSLCAEGFAMDPDEFRDHFTTDPETGLGADPAGIFVVREDGRLVSSVRVFTRRIWLSGQSVRCGAIGEVTTLPPYRKRGYSGLLLQTAIRYMEEREMPVSQLLTGVNPHYERYGWVTVPRVLGTAVIDAAPLPGLREVRAGDGKALSALHAACGRFDSCIDRSAYGDDYWIGWMKRNPGKRFVWEQNGAIAAYADLEAKDGRLVFREYLGEPDGLCAVFGGLADLYGFSGSLPLTDVPLPLADLCGLTLTDRRTATGLMQRGGTIPSLDAAVFFEADDY